jgi:hypothetical protein
MKRELIVTANGRDRAVTVDGPLDDGRFRVAIDGAERLVDARVVRPGTWSLVIDGASFVVDLDPRRAGVAASVGASEVLLTVEDALHRRLAESLMPHAINRAGLEGVPNLSGKGERQERQMASAFDGGRQLTLVFGTCAGLAAWPNFSVLGHETAQHI